MEAQGFCTTFGKAIDNSIWSCDHSLVTSIIDLRWVSVMLVMDDASSSSFPISSSIVLRIVNLLHFSTELVDVRFCFLNFPKISLYQLRTPVLVCWLSVTFACAHSLA
eukprot:Gb_06257 [translate_table: standard]